MHVSCYPALSTLTYAGTHDFAQGACERLEPYVSSELVGQDLAVHQACDAICDHLATEEPQKPLVLSAHGPPGVGKSMMHLLLARSLYSKQPSDQLKCPGRHCLGYKASNHFPFANSLLCQCSCHSQIASESRTNMALRI